MEAKKYSNHHNERIIKDSLTSTYSALHGSLAQQTAISKPVPFYEKPKFCSKIPDPKEFDATCFRNASPLVESVMRDWEIEKTISVSRSKSQHGIRPKSIDILNSWDANASLIEEDWRRSKQVSWSSSVRQKISNLFRSTLYILFFTTTTTTPSRINRHPPGR